MLSHEREKLARSHAVTIARLCLVALCYKEQRHMEFEQLIKDEASKDEFTLCLDTSLHSQAAFPT
jgi:hypothetical protein